MASSIAIWLGVMKTESSPGSLKSVCAANRLTEASGNSLRPASAAAAMASRVPPMQ